MKISSKIKAIILSMVCAAALTSCGNKGSEIPDITSGETSGTTAAAISEKITIPVTEDEAPAATAYEIIWVNSHNTIADTSSEVMADTSSSAEYPHLTPLTDEARFWLHHDYIKNLKWDDRVTVYDVRIVYYYGTYDSGEVVVMIPAYSHKNEKYFSVAGYEFEFSSTSYKIFLHTDSTFIPLDEAYESGYLSDKDIEEIHYHAEHSEIAQPYLKLKQPELTPLTDEAEQKLREDYAKLQVQKGYWSGLTADDVHIDCYYGTYDSGEVVVMYRYDESIAHTGKYFYVAGYEFYLFTCSFDIMLHTDSTFIEINDAYKQGYLSDEDIMEIHYHAKRS